MAQAQLYNNPAFASGLGDLLQTMIAPKDASAAAQYDAQRAGMLADTRNYRLGLGRRFRLGGAACDAICSAVGFCRSSVFKM